MYNDLQSSSWPQDRLCRLVVHKLVEVSTPSSLIMGGYSRHRKSKSTCIISHKLASHSRTSLCHHRTQSACVRDPRARLARVFALAITKSCRATARDSGRLYSNCRREKDKGNGASFCCRVGWVSYYEVTAVVIFLFVGLSFISISPRTECTCPSSSAVLLPFQSGAAIVSALRYRHPTPESRD
jgi:hypothetical protein